MGVKSKANKARLRNIQSALSRSHKATVEDVSDSEEEHYFPKHIFRPGATNLTAEEESDDDSYVEQLDKGEEDQDNDLQDFINRIDVFRDEDPSSCSDSEDDIEFSMEEEAEIQDEAALLTFSEILFQAQNTASEGERQRSKDTRRPKHYTGNSTRTLQHHALRRKTIAGTNQTFISSWMTKKPEVEDVRVNDTESPYEPSPVREEEEESYESASDSSGNSMGKNPSQSSPVEILSSESEKEEQIHKMLEDIQKGQPPCDDSPESFMDLVLNALDYKDFPALRRAQAKIAVNSKDKKLDVVFQSHITAMLGALNLYLDPELSYGWREASLIALKSLGQGINHARSIRTWIHQFLCNGKLPLHRYGQYHSSILEDEDFTQEIQLHLSEVQQREGHI
ncbi:hypothetical protein F4604DRAFT_1923521 [Suillus subluteus]|nr:hypothetical protein F4604DRAFT_1923521 [Suillus subluteus]